MLHLEYFLAVAKHKSFTKAAQAMHISQPSISKMVKDMEEELGVTLFLREGKQVTLTDAGEAVHQQAQQIYFSFQNLTTTLSDVMQLRKGRIKVGIPSIVGASFFPKIIGEFIETYPEIELELIEVGSKTIETGVDSGELDIGIICSAPSKAEGLVATPFVKDPLMVILHPEHRLASQDKISLSDLKEERFVMYREDFSLHDNIMELCKNAGYEPKVVCRSSQRDFMVEMVASKLGIALLPSKICRELDPNKVIWLPIDNQPIFLDLMIIWKKGKYLSFATREWLTFTALRLGLTLPPLS